jgi:hypothetical protein
MKNLSIKNSKQGFAPLIILIIVGIVAIVGTGYYYKKVAKEGNANLNSNKLKEFTDHNSGFTFSYPADWKASYHPAVREKNNLVGDYYSVTKELGDKKLELVLRTGIEGVGGACPDFDPKKEVVATKKISITGKTNYVIYYGDTITKNIDYAYVSEDANGECPNLPFVGIQGIPGLFSARLSLSDNKDKALKLNLASETDLRAAENIIASIKVVKADQTKADQKKETDNWKTYSNIKYGFEFIYPSDFNIFMREYDAPVGSGNIDSAIFYIQKDSQPKDSDGQLYIVLSAHYTPYISSLALSEYVNQYNDNINACPHNNNCPETKVVTSTSVSVSGLSGIRQETSSNEAYISGGVVSIETYFKKNKSSLWSLVMMKGNAKNTGYTKQEIGIYDQMLSSFKFTK